ncbi:DUF1223 domain-containing protein [Caulobacter sp. NIBR2454]|uniref:DUF1223 domain-containing protein n=1 Tax=Caulobacter sp. NIBR2454 TaxID=3015996 RepID=UPI0022B6FCB8|nr:DUF1223 domain-containing protein [Caulobacter sp. NIBR2454]
MAQAAPAKTPVVVELFTAQGCAPCVKANEHVAAMADRPGLLPLTFSVDYWDYLGWADTFAKPAFADRQRAYVAKLQLRDPYTPQVVIDGRAQASGAKPQDVDKLVREATEAGRNPPDMLLREDGKVAVGSGPAPRGGGEVWLIRYDPKPTEVQVKRGDNRGETIVYRNVVRDVARLGVWNGRPRLYSVPAPLGDEDGLESVVLVQGAKGGRVIGVMKAER